MSSASRKPAVLLRSEQADGEISVIYSAMPAGSDGSPLHHHQFDEAFYILDGVVTFQLADDRLTAGTGDLAFAPRGVPHTLANLGDAPASYLLVCTPAGFERVFARRIAKREGVDPPEWARQPAPEVTMVGPRISRPPATSPTPPIRREHAAAAAFTPQVLVRSEQSDDQVAVIHNAVPAGWGGPPLHHHDFDEAFYVLAGELTFQLGDELSSAGPGELVFAPRGSHHTLANLSDENARYLLVCTPAGFERYFDRIATRPTSHRRPRRPSLTPRRPSSVPRSASGDHDRPSGGSPKGRRRAWP